jgi:4-hydroxy-3-polyprenylbenzoate decarboxylase
MLMAYNGLIFFINTLDERGELVRVKNFVNPELMITEIADRFSKEPGGGKALLFENTGTEFPLLINFMGSEKRISLALGRESLDEIEQELDFLFSKISQPKDNLWDKLKLLPLLKEVSAWMPVKLKKRGKCQEVVFKSADLNKLPVLKCWPADGGRFITLPCVHTVDPETNLPNLGMYRMQVFEDNLTGMHWHMHKTGAAHFKKYKNRGMIMPVSVTLGGDPAYTYAATAPMPENIDEYLLAGFLRKKPVRLVKCLTNDLYVPEDADFVIEGYIDPSEDLIWEGPFGDHTGFYSLADFYPGFHINCITHRRDAVYPATIVGIPPMEDAYIGKATERIFLKPIRMALVPEIKDMDMPFAGVAHNLLIIKIEKNYPGQAIKVANALWGAGQMMFNKIIVVVDETADIHNYNELTTLVRENFDPDLSLHFSKGPLDILDHSSQKFAFGSKLCIDLTKPFDEEKVQNYNRPDYYSDPAESDFRGLEYISGFRNLQEDISVPVILFNIRKPESYSKRSIELRLEGILYATSVKAVILYDEDVNLYDLNTLTWLLGGNLDPVRDISFIKKKDGSHFILTDATVKTFEHDNFNRKWPNIVIMDDETIAETDKRWNEPGLGDLIKSPSLKYRSLARGGDAIRENL